MKVHDLMTQNVRVCRPETDMAEASVMMLESDCGALPVVDETGRVLAMITDRDIAICVATKGRPANEIPVSAAMSRELFFTKEDQDIKTALKTMRHDKIRRLPVIDDHHKLIGILSLNDIVCRAEEAKGSHIPNITYEDAMSTFKAICEHRPHHFVARA